MSAPPSTQTTFHPEFSQEVKMVVFSVEGQGFKTDSIRLTMHSKFLRDMFFMDLDIGNSNEGTVDHPIVVQGCSKETFANFLRWLNHHAWDNMEAEHVKQALDILHVSHMWGIRPGYDFAIQQLNRFSLRPAHGIFLAQRYNIPTWIPDAVRTLLVTPFQHYTDEDLDHLSFPAFMIIARAKEDILEKRRQCAYVSPYPEIFGDDAPHCPRHEMCRKVWQAKWYQDIVPRIHHPTERFFLESIPYTLKQMEHPGMSTDCKTYVLEWIRTFCPGLGKEEALIWKAIDSITLLLGITDFDP